MGSYKENMEHTRKLIEVQRNRTIYLWCHGVELLLYNKTRDIGKITHIIEFDGPEPLNVILEGGKSMGFKCEQLGHIQK